MSDRPIVMYLGGFAKVGGIEAFARDFLLAIAPVHPRRQLVMWGEGSNHRLLDEVVDSGVAVTRSPWRWGCVWNLPDYVLVPAGLRSIWQAEVVIFKRPPPRPILVFLRRVSRATGRHIPFILVMPYRPVEYWGENPPASAYEHFDIITVQSEEGVEDLKRFGYQGHIENIPLLPPPSSVPVDYPFRQGNGVIRLGFLGRLAAQKNVGYLLEIYQALTRKIAPTQCFELHLFGDGAQRAELERRCAELELANVVFHGAAPREDVARAIDSCDLFLITSVTEGQCLVALEVLSRGRPLVATPVGALPEVLRQPEVGRLAPLGQPEAFAVAVADVVAAMRDNRITPQSVVASFRTKYDYEATVDRYLALLTESVSVPAPAHDPRQDAVPIPRTVSIMITTKNRLHELRRTCRVLRQLAPAPLEILITADGCTDGTAEFVKAEMPTARLFINAEGKGSIASRDNMIRESCGDLVLSLDDDSYPQETDCLARILDLFAARPRMAVLHFPQCTDEYPETLPHFDFGAPRATRSFSSAGAVLRRSTYLQLPGFEPSFFHAYEEPDYALQCVAAGHEIFYDPSVSIRHHYSGTARDENRTHLRHARNEFWSTLLRCPFPHVVALALYDVCAQFRYACSRGIGWVIREPIWWVQALAGIPRNLAHRQPVSWADYRRWLTMTEIAYPPLPPRAPASETQPSAKPRTA